MRHFRSTLENGIVLHALVKQLLARREDPLVRAAVVVGFVGFAAGGQLIEAQAAGSRGSVGVLVDGSLGAGVLGWALARDWSRRLVRGDRLAGAVGQGAGCLRRAGGCRRRREGEVVRVDRG